MLRQARRVRRTKERARRKAVVEEACNFENSQLSKRTSSQVRIVTPSLPTSLTRAGDDRSWSTASRVSSFGGSLGLDDDVESLDDDDDHCRAHRHDDAIGDQRRRAVYKKRADKQAHKPCSIM